MDKANPHMPKSDRETRILELRRLVQSGQYKVDPKEVAARIIRKSEKSEPTRPKAIVKTANNGQ